MSGQKDIPNDGQIKALEAFVMDRDLERLEGLLRPFNLFEAIGAVHMEVRHSDFLAFLLEPSQKHGLGDLFLKRLLQRILAKNAAGPDAIRPVHIDVMNLSKTTVHREWEHTDIFCVKEDEENRLIVLIENKIDSGEGEGQLERYLQEVERSYPPSKGFRTIPLFLTPDGDRPSDDRYMPVGYSTVCKTLEELLEQKVHEEWQKFLTHNLPGLVSAVKKIFER
jgi:hypothetical protein